jgi:hypothetical protein
MMMSDVDRLLRDYIERFESGGSVDPSDLLEGLETGDRRKLSVLIEGYLEHAARPKDWDAEAFEGSLADRAVQRVAAAWSAEAEQLPAELVRLRNEREITREDLVTRLAEALGVSGARAKVASYYHRLERGLLPTEGVSTKVWEALAGLLGTSSDSLREAAASAPQGEAAAGPAYARTAGGYPPEAETAAGMPSPGEPDEPDEVDRLFTGG